MTKIVRRTPAQVIALWLKALRSGKYEQTVGVLKDDAGYCCLGVLCDLAAKDGGQQFHKFDEYNQEFYDGEALDPPHEMSKYLGLSSYHRGRLILMNDIEGKSFAQIADYIEAHIKVPT
jgi:hypothetical protein